jgi:hypothetical protein
LQSPARFRSIRTFAALALLASPLAGHSQFVIESATDLFTPSFRGSVNSAYFGYSKGSFRSAPGVNVIKNLAPDLGTAAGSFSQVHTIKTVSGSGNIYFGNADLATEGLAFETFDLSVPIDVPTAQIGTAFTTIIVQFNSLRTAWSGGYLPDFLSLGGTAPSFVGGTNSADSSLGQIGSSQVWAKIRDRRQCGDL